MDRKKVEELIGQIDNYLECWKQFNRFLGVGRSKKFGQDDESQFLELKAQLAQQLEIILASVERSALSREEVLQLMESVPSLRYLGEQGDGLHRTLESQWHKIYIAGQSILGQLKVQQQTVEPKRSLWSKLFGPEN
jgi:hypothetical protein